MLQQVSTALGRASPIIGSSLAFVLGQQVAGGLQARDAFAAYACFQSLRLVLVMLPNGLQTALGLQVGARCSRGRGEGAPADGPSKGR